MGKRWACVSSYCLGFVSDCARLYNCEHIATQQSHCCPSNLQGSFQSQPSARLRPSFRDFLDGKEVQAVGWRAGQVQVICPTAGQLKRFAGTAGVPPANERAARTRNVSLPELYQSESGTAISWFCSRCALTLGGTQQIT